MTDVRPFPIAALETLTRAEVLAAERLRRATREHVRASELAKAVSEIAKDEVEVLVRRHRRAEARFSPADAVGVVLSIDAHRTGEREALVEADAALAALLSAKALGRPAPRFLDASRPPPPALTGAFAAVAVACLRRAHSGSSFRIVSAGPAAALSRDLLAKHRHATTAFLTVVVGADAFDARVTMPDSAAFSVPSACFDVEALERLGDAPLSVPIVAATCLARRSEIASLARGDAFVVPRLDPKRGALVPPRGERGLSADLADGARLVVRGLLESHSWEVPEMAGDTTSKTTAEVLEDASVVVRVELGAVEMKAREWAALSPGDVITLGRKLGEPAILRVGGVEVARGELVQVDGEYGVRIL